MKQLKLKMPWLIAIICTTVMVSVSAAILLMSGQKEAPSVSVIGYEPIVWSKIQIINNESTREDAGPDARGINPGKFGSEYPRMLKLDNGDWLAVYTVYRNNGYLADPDGGLELEIARSSDNCRTWTTVSVIKDPGRDLDNGQMIQLKNGDILLSARSVRWQESYRIPVYISKDLGATWEFLSDVDENTGKPGELGNPDKGLYEPHFYMLDDGRVSIMYSSEKHVTEKPSYSQTISQKISDDNGKTWGDEILVAWDAKRKESRPGMAVWTKMKNGRYIVVFEVFATENVDIFYKTSDDGITWEEGIGKRIPGQTGAPYILSLEDGRLVVTSNTYNISISEDFGETWSLQEKKPFMSVFDGGDNWWPSLYQTGPNEIAILTSATRRTIPGHNIKIRFGTWESSQISFDSGDIYIITSAATGRSLELQDNSTVGQRDTDASNKAQQWRFEGLSEGYCKIVSSDNRVLTYNGDAAGSREKIMLTRWENKASQMWKLEYTGSGAVKIVNREALKALGIINGMKTDNAIIYIGDYTGADHQKWELKKIDRQD